MGMVRALQIARGETMKGMLIKGRWILPAACALLVMGVSALAQGTATPGGTVIHNKASATYTDDVTSPTKYSATSNDVTTTVAYVAGLEITPDASAPATTVNPGATGTYTFTVKNLGNFTDNVEFAASGASIRLTGTGTVSQGFIDVNSNGTYEAGTDVDIKGNGAAVSYSLAQGASVPVVIKILADVAATGGTALKVELGDASTGGPTFDNQAANNSANEVHTKSPGGITPVNGEREAKGDITYTISNISLVKNGPTGNAEAVGPGPSDNTDYTNKAVSQSATNTAVVFDNTLKNKGNFADTVKISVASGGAAAGSKVEISLDGGSTWTTVILAGAATATPDVTTGSVAAGATLNYKVRVTLPAGVTAYSASDTVISATSVGDSTQKNNTIDRIYAGYLQLTKTAVVVNSTGVGAATDAVPGAFIDYTVAYANVANTPTGTGNVDLDALQVVITEDGDTGTNNWASTTDQVSATEVDSRGGSIAISSSTGGVANSKYVDTVGTLPAGQSGTLKFRRKIKS